MNRLTQLSAGLACGLAGLLWLTPKSARADDPRLAVDLFQSARQLMSEGKYDKACPMLVDSQKADPQPGTQLNLAVCYEKVGKTASAWSVYSDLMQSGGPLQKQTASAAVERLQPKLSRLKIDVCERPNFDPSTLVVTRNGQELGGSMLGRPSPVDAGVYHIDASAPGFAPWSRSVKVDEEGDLQSVEICALQAEPRPATPALTPAARKQPTTRRPYNDASPPAEQPHPSATWAYVSGGVGAAAAIVSVTFALVAVGQKADAKTACPDKRCTPDGWSKLDSARHSADVATVALAVAGAAGAATLYFALRSPAEEQGRSVVKAPRIALSSDRAGWAVALTGAF